MIPILIPRVQGLIHFHRKFFGNPFQILDLRINSYVSNGLHNGNKKGSIGIMFSELLFLLWNNGTQTEGGTLSDWVRVGFPDYINRFRGVGTGICWLLVHRCRYRSLGILRRSVSREG